MASSSASEAVEADVASVIENDMLNDSNVSNSSNPYTMKKKAVTAEQKEEEATACSDYQSLIDQLELESQKEMSDKKRAKVLKKQKEAKDNLAVLKNKIASRDAYSNPSTKYSRKLRALLQSDKKAKRIVDKTKLPKFNEYVSCVAHFKSCIYCDADFSTVGGASFDRIDNDVAHHKDNIVLSCANCNKMRGRWYSIEDFYSLRNTMKQMTSGLWPEERPVRNGGMPTMDSLLLTINVTVQSSSAGEADIPEFHFDSESEEDDMDSNFLAMFDTTELPEL
eukprot:gene7812-9320_t